MAADQSLRRPAFALLGYDGQGSVSLQDKCNLHATAKVPHGSILTFIYDTAWEWIGRADALVREGGFARYIAGTKALYKVMGVTDLAAWQAGQRVFDEIAPCTVKLLVTGSGRASKQAVAAALEGYVGRQTYACLDESDAVAVGIAWLIQHGHIRGTNHAA